MNINMPPLKGSKRKSEVSNRNFIVALTSTAANDNKLHYNCQHYSQKVLNNLKSLRYNSRFCDVEIVAGGKIIKAHRAVLAASSPYFHAMFTGGLLEEQQKTIELHYISPHILDILMVFIYSGEVLIDQKNVQELMVAADMLELAEVVLGCTEYLKNELHPTNAVGIYRFAEAHHCEELRDAAVHYIQSHFPKVCEEDEIYDLPKDQLIRFLCSEHLRVDSEFQVFHSAVRWITQDIVNRRRYVFEILKHVRLPLISVPLLERSISECADSSLRVALKSVYTDLINRKGSLVPLRVNPRICAKKHIFVIGGSKRELTDGYHRGLESNFSSIERFDTYKREWCAAPSMRISRILPGVACLEGRIYVVGGEQDSNSLCSGEWFDARDNTWVEMAPMNVPRCEFGLCALDGYLYAMGGWVGGEIEDIGGTIERYNPTRDEWCYVGRLPEPRFSMGVVSYEGLIYMVGGCSENQRHLQDLICYNPATGIWRTLPPMSEARSQMGVAVLDGYLYVVGGNNRDQQVLNSVERYSFKKNKWSSLPNMLVARRVPAVAAADGLLFVIGGGQTHNVTFYRAHFTLASVECYDPVSNSWEDCAPLPESRAEAGAVVV